MNADTRTEERSDDLEVLAEAGDWRSYLDLIARHMADGEPSLAMLNQALRRSAEAPESVEGYRRVRLGILRNVTVEPWLPAIFGGLVQRGILPSFWVGDFDVYEPYAFDPDGSLAHRKLDLLWVHFDAGVLAGDSHFAPPGDLGDRAGGRIMDVVDRLVEGWSGQVIVSNLADAPWDVMAPLAYQQRMSWLNQRRAVNLSLVERWEAEPRVHLLDVDEAVTRIGAGHAYDARMHLTARSPYSTPMLLELGRQMGALVSPLYLPPRKCLVVDCDNTLWRGILGEDGPEGLQLGDSYPGVAYREFQLFLKALSENGFILAINSKNDEGAVVSFVDGSPDMRLRMSDFAAYRINWRDKVTNLRELAEEINIGLDSMVFIDDSPVECELVASMLPEVQVERFPEDPVGIYRFVERLQGVERLWVTEDDRKRAASYRANVQREKLRREVTDLRDFIRGLEIRLTVTRQDRQSIQRITQLTQRTNQFNLTTRRYEVEEVERFFQEGAVYTLRMEDRFSDYGMVSVMILAPCAEAPDAWEIDTFLVSCRAFGRRVEEVFLRTVLRDMAHRGVGEVRGTYRRTEKNGMTRDFYPSQGFVPLRQGEEDAAYAVTLPAADHHPDDELYTVERRGF